MKYIIAFLIAATPLLSYEEPSYKVIAKHDNIEQREYGAMLIAEVHTFGQRKEAIKDGLRILADYIFGNNSLKTKIAMTVPVMAQSSETISLESKIDQHLQGKKWTVRFIFPGEYTIENVPKPETHQISLHTLPAKKVAVIRYSGRSGDENTAPQLEKLQKYFVQQHLEFEGAPIFAYYNPPWTLPFLRRNEIMVQIKENDNNEHLRRAF